ncbi:MAG: hypothetical protein V2A73_17655, partial [Pseudomonadota bacterium]
VPALFGAALWLAVVWGRRRRSSSGIPKDACRILTSFVERSLTASSFREVAVDAATTAKSWLRASGAVLFEPSDEVERWDAVSADGSLLGLVSDAASALFSWMRESPMVIYCDEAHSQRYESVRPSLVALEKEYPVDVVIPLVRRGEVIGAIGLSVRRRLTTAEKSVLEHFRVRVAAAVSNVHLGREVAYRLNLEGEPSLEKAAGIALLPATIEGQTSG